MESDVSLPCPQCSEIGMKMLAMTAEIAYFGEHTQITLICDSCGWKHTDFIPSDGEKAEFWSIMVNSEEKLSARIIRSSSCTIRIPELDLEVSPGSSSSGFVTNVEGVILRFEEAVETILRGTDSFEESNSFNKAESILKELRVIREGSRSVTLVLLDPKGRSQILHEEAIARTLSKDEVDELETGFDLV